MTQRDKLKLLKFDSPRDLVNSLTEFIREKIELNLVNSGNCSIAMSGGKTPLNLYSNISESNIDWSKVDLSIVDERFVDLQSKHSNQNNILKSLALDIKKILSHFMVLILLM